MKPSIGIAVIAIAGSMLTACASTTPVPLQASPSRQPPASLTSLCPDLPEAQDGRLATLFRNSLERSALYYECQARHKALVEWATPPQQQIEEK